jgi:hypothetical protein
VIAYHEQIKLKRLGPQAAVREEGVVGVYTLTLWYNGKPVKPRKRLTAEQLIDAEVVFGCASFGEYDVGRARVTARVRWIEERPVVRRVWRRLHNLFVYIDFEGFV